MAVAKHIGAIERAGVRQASAAGSPLRAGPEAADLGSGIRTASLRRGTSSGLEAHRWSRRLIAWVFRRGVRLARRGRTPHALRVMRRLAHLAPGLGFVQLSLARLASSLGDMETARPAMRAALATASAKAHRYHCRVAALLLRLQELDSAEACLESASRAFPESSRVWLLLAELERYRGKNGEAAQSCEQALALARTNAERIGVLAGLAGCCADTGREDEAIAACRRMIELAPNNASGYYHLVNCGRGADIPDGAIERMVQMLGSRSFPLGQRMSLHYSLATVHDSRGEYAEAFAHLASANSSRAQLNRRFSTGQLKKELEVITKIFDPEFISAMSKHGCPDDFLICIVGFPRSGTTLTEQILSSHPGVTGLGERSDFHRAASGLQLKLRSRQPYPRCCSAIKPRHIRELASTVRAQLFASAGPGNRVVTKSPGDCWLVGLIKILFPNTRFVHCHRQPIDNCLSCYMQAFDAITFSTDLTVTAEVYRLYRGVMSHWRRVLPLGSILECPYEATVAEPESAVRALHEHCGLPLNENWSRFHEHPRRVDTASQWQVRRPIYQTSVERWKNYAPFLGPLLDLVED